MDYLNDSRTPNPKRVHFLFDIEKAMNYGIGLGRPKNRRHKRIRITRIYKYVDRKKNTDMKKIEQSEYQPW